jgi:curved DNA-binding protein
MAKRDYYQVLGVSRKADADEIKSAYRKLARKYHPDVNKAADAGDRFREATEAYEVLSDPQKRKMYDQFGHAGPQQQPFGAGAGRPGPGGGRVYGYGPGQGGGGFNFEEIFGGGGGGSRSGFMGMGLEEILEALRGGGARRAGSRGGGAGAPRAAQRGGDIEHEVSLDFMQAVGGAVVELRLAGGESSQTLSVKIPPGVKEGQRIRLRGKGQGGPGGAGDLYIVTHIRPHPYFRREDHDLYVDLPISITEAALGAKVDVPTLEGTSTVTIPPGSSSGRKLRLRGRGVVGPGGKRGDQYVVLRVVAPQSVSDEGRKLLQQFAQEERLDPRADVPWKK